VWADPEDLYELLGRREVMVETLDDEQDLARAENRPPRRFPDLREERRLVEGELKRRRHEIAEALGDDRLDAQKREMVTQYMFGHLAEVTAAENSPGASPDTFMAALLARADVMRQVARCTRQRVWTDEAGHDERRLVEKQVEVFTAVHPAVGQDPLSGHAYDDKLSCTWYCEYSAALSHLKEEFDAVAEGAAAPVKSYFQRVGLLKDQFGGAMSSARHAECFEGLVAQQHSFMRDIWCHSDSPSDCALYVATAEIHVRQFIAELRELQVANATHPSFPTFPSCLTFPYFPTFPSVPPCPSYPSFVAFFLCLRSRASFSHCFRV
jgi:hypothetical protein